MTEIEPEALEEEPDTRNFVRLAKVAAVIIFWIIVALMVTWDWRAIFLALPFLVIGAPLVWAYAGWSRTPETPMAFVCFAAARTEAEMYGTVLRVAGIPFRIVNTRDYDMDGGGWPASYEVWVPSRDEAQAREALGLQPDEAAGPSSKS